MKTLVALLLALPFLVGGAYGQSSSMHATTAAPAKHSVEVEKHIKDLHAKLKITSAEESQWASVAQVMRENASQLDQAIEKREAGGTAVDDLNAYGDVVQAHADAIKKLAAAFSTLYASMPDEQKKVADQLFAQRTAKHMAMK